ncbi:MAG: hypothetical protein NTW49_10355 [Bacteroidia bacterium]|nr:hypothetical protein [Bacteroidia bacterium]
MIIISCQCVFAQSQIWNVGTAKTLPPLDFRIAALQPSTIGLPGSMELSSQPVACIFAPNISLKKRWYAKRIIIATNHGFIYPTPALKQLANNGFDDLLNKQTFIPQIFAFHNEILISKEQGGKQCSAYFEPDDNLKKNIIYTLKIGFQFAVKSGKSSFEAIKRPVLYPRTSIYQDTLLLYAGFDVDGPFYKNINFSADIDVFSIGFKDFAIENKGLLVFTHSDRFSWLFGYKLSAGSFPDKFRIGIYPLFDLMWYFHRLKVKDGLGNHGLK